MAILDANSNNNDRIDDSHHRVIAIVNDNNVDLVKHDQLEWIMEIHHNNLIQIEDSIKKFTNWTTTNGNNCYK